MQPGHGDPSARASAPAVTVIVPVHNAGPALERSISSVLGQTLAGHGLEAIFVDDGSTDGSGARLDALAASHPWIRVEHIPASGSPGRPRNLALDMAGGAYIFFLDADDRLAPFAMERLAAMARANDADVVIGKLVSNFRNVSWDLFRKTVQVGTWHDAPVIANLTVCKLFRTAFLREQGIRFPEGWPKIEDELLVTTAYLRARVISVYADEPVYYYCERDDGANLSSRPLDPDEYYSHLRRILDLVRAEAEPPDERARFLRRFYRTEMLGRLADPAWDAGDTAYRRRVFDAMRALALDCLDDRVHDGLGAVIRLRSTLLREGRFEQLERLVDREARLRVDAVATGWRTQDGALDISYRARLLWDDGAPFTLLRAGGRVYLDPRLTEGILDGPPDVTGELDDYRLNAVVEETGGWVEWVVPAGSRLKLARGEDASHVVPVARGTITIRPDSMGPAGVPLTLGPWSVVARIRGLGLDIRGPLAPADGARGALLPALLRPDAAAAMPVVEPGRPVSLTVVPGVDGAGGWQGSVRPWLVAHDDRFDVVLPMTAGERVAGATALVAGGDPAVRGEHAVARHDGVRLTIRRASLAALGDGRHPLGLHVDGRPVPLGEVVITGGQVGIEGIRTAGPVERMSGEVRLQSRRVARGVRSRLAGLKRKIKGRRAAKAGKALQPGADGTTGQSKG